MEPGSQEQSCSTARRKIQAWDLDLKTASGKYINLLYLIVQASAPAPHPAAHLGSLWSSDPFSREKGVAS